ncbi:MAG: hypothetical protein WCJ29_06210 [bacterium]
MQGEPSENIESIVVEIQDIDPEKLSRVDRARFENACQMKLAMRFAEKISGKSSDEDVIKWIMRYGKAFREALSRSQKMKNIVYSGAYNETMYDALQRSLDALM